MDRNQVMERLIESLAQYYREQDRCPHSQSFHRELIDREEEWIILTTNLDSSFHVFKIHSRSGLLDVQKRYFIQVELKYEIKRAFEYYPDADLCQKFTNFIFSVDTSFPFQELRTRYFELLGLGYVGTEDALERQQQETNCKEVFFQLFSYFYFHPCEVISLQWWDRYLTEACQSLSNVYFMNELTLLE